MRVGTVFLATALAALIPAAGRTVELPDEPARPSAVFPRPAALEPQIKFWRAIFAEYSTHQVVLHDALYLDKIYKVLDFRQQLDDGLSPGEVDRVQRIDTDLELERVRATLLRLHGLGPDPQGLTPEEQAVYDMFRDDPAPDRFLAAADEKRLRSQSGLRERFGEGLHVSRRYLPEMERIFREEGLPVELTRLPLIESCFNLRAYSKVGAAGIWQFMPATGRRFIRVDHLVDERRDPISATRAAALYLSEMHDILDSWPLAITAYNHGPQGLARAVDEIGTNDIGIIVRNYRGKAFGFASRNFYAEFLAALDVEGDHQSHFGELPAPGPWRYREHRIDRPVGIQAAARLANVDRDELALLNPALSELIVSGRRPIPAGYRLRMPEADAEDFTTRLAEVKAEEPVIREPVTRVTRVAAKRPAKGRAAVRPAVLTHRVRKGQTLSHIAKQHRVSVESLRRTNRLGKSTRLRAGQVIKVHVAQSST
jgi:membrane-bound lytic murein transglycosylase D